MTARRKLGIGVIGLGWMGGAHSRAMVKIPMHYPERTFDPRLVMLSDTVAARREEGVSGFGFARTTDNWRAVVEAPEVDVVVCTAPNMLHLEIVEAAAAAGKAILCEKPVGGTPEQTAKAEYAARKAGVVSGVGYNYRWAPLVQYARQLIANGTLGEITNYRGRFFSMYGADPMGLLSWRFLVDQAGYGVSTDILSHSVDLSHYLLGVTVDRLVATTHTYIKERPLPNAGGTHYDRGQPGDPTGTVTNEDYVGMLCTFTNGVRGAFETSRAIIGPESQNAFEVYGTKGSITWNFEKMNELQVYIASDTIKHTGYTTVYGGDRFPSHGNFVPGAANGIGFEELIAIEDHAFLTSVTAGVQHAPGFAEALDFVSVQDAVLRSAASERWETVHSLRIND
jgi:predicted dehydrogenase